MTNAIDAANKVIGPKIVDYLPVALLQLTESQASHLRLVSSFLLPIPYCRPSFLMSILLATRTVIATPTATSIGEFSIKELSENERP